MITCKFEDGKDAELRHDVTHALALKDNKILLVKRAEGILEAGKWGFPGGFLDRNETLKEGVLRELMEETGFTGKVVNLLRINSKPNRRNDAGRQNVSHEFLIEVGEKTGVPDWEQTEVKFWEINDLTEETMAFDHYETIQILKKYLKGDVIIPIVEG
jgi:8-oxo-dGTP diphosphatase